MQVFDLNIPAHLKFGLDVVNRVGNEASVYGRKVLLVTEGILHESGTIDRVENILTSKGCDVIVFDDVIPNAMSDVATSGLDISRNSYCDVIVGLGGIRALSIAKAIAALSNETGDIDEYIDGRLVEAEPVAYIEIPSTPRNPFMFRDEFWITDARNRSSHILRVKERTTKKIIYDPTITTTLPRRFTATTIIDTLANAIEGYISTESNFLSDILFLQSIGLFAKNIYQAVNIPDDLTARANLSLGGLMTSLGLSMSSTGTVAAVSYVLSSKHRLHKSLTSSVLLPHVMDFNITSVPAKLVKIAEALGEDLEGLTVVDAAIKAIEKVRKIIIELELPMKLDEFDIDKDEMINVADDARAMKMFNYVPRTCTSEELYAILQAAY